jgi:hypothetical protein
VKKGSKKQDRKRNEEGIKANSKTKGYKETRMREQRRK